MSGGRRPRERWVPAYDLVHVKAAFREGRFGVTRRVRVYLLRQGWTDLRICDAVADLESSDFYKSQEHLARPGVWLDIYRPNHAGDPLYVKYVRERARDRFQVLSFCRDGEQH